MKKLSSLILSGFGIAMWLPACAEHHQTAQTSDASNTSRDSRYVTSVGRSKVPVTENRDASRIPGR
jgi:hypothetical protein